MIVGEFGPRLITRKPRSLISYFSGSGFSTGAGGCSSRRNACSTIAFNVVRRRAAVRGHADLAETRRILAAWGMANAVDAGAVQRQADAFLAWVRQRWPQGRIHVETPLEAGAPDGTRLRGRTDLLVDTPQGWVLVDHKSNPGGTDRDEALATRYAPQLAAYAQALQQATGRPVVERWLYLAVGGRVVGVLA